MGGSIDIAGIAFLLFHLSDIGSGFVSRFASSGLNDAVEGFIDIFGHAFGIAADIEMRAFLQPLPKFVGGLEHAGLHVDLLFLIAAEGGVESREEAFLHPLDDLIVVEKVTGAFLVAKEEPVFAGGGGGFAFFEESAERSDAGAWADMMTGFVRSVGKRK